MHTRLLNQPRSGQVAPPSIYSTCSNSPFRFRNQLLVADADKSLQPDFRRQQLGRLAVFQQAFRRQVTSNSSGLEKGECSCETTQLPATLSVSRGCDEVAPRDSSA